MNTPLQDSFHTAPDQPPTPPARKKRFTKRVGRFDENGHATQAYYDEQASFPVASAATDRISGISSGTTPSAVSKLTLACALPSLGFRQNNVDDLFKMQRVALAPSTARVFKERNGRGQEFYQVRYELPRQADGRRRQKSIYLGYDPDLAAWARDILIEKRWQESRRMPHTLDHGRIESLREAGRRCWVIARKITSRTNFYFHGYRLRERRNERKH